MVQKDTYDFEAKNKYRDLLRKFILKHFPKGSQRERLRVACLPGHEGLEVTEVYFPLGIRPNRIWGIEQDQAIAQQIRDLKLGINVYEGEAGDFFAHPGEQFDVINLDFQSQFGDPQIDVISSAFHNFRVRPHLILGTNFYGSREGSRRIDRYKKLAEDLTGGSKNLVNLLNLTPEQKEDWHKRFHPQILDLKGEDLEAKRDNVICTGLRYLTSANSTAETILDLKEILPQVVKNIDYPASPEEVLAEPMNHPMLGVVLSTFYGTLVENSVMNFLEILKQNKEGFYCGAHADRILSYYLQLSNLRRPFFITDFHKGRYVSDNGSPMFFDFLNLQLRKDLFVNSPVSIDNLNVDKILGEMQLRDLQEYNMRRKSLEDLDYKEVGYLNSERQEIQVKPDGEKIREALQSGIPEEEIMKQFGLTSRMQLAGHKAALSRANGNGNGKKTNGNLYHPTTQEEAEILEFLETGMPDDEIISAYHLTKMQLAARKAMRTRKNGNGNGKNLELRTQILERDGYQCQYPQCPITQEDNVKQSGHSLHVHHIDYNHENSVPTNMISLCTGHHAMTNTVQHGPEMKKVLEERIKELFSEQVSSPLEAVK